MGKLPKLQITTETVKRPREEESWESDYKHNDTGRELKKQTSPLTWIVMIVVGVVVFMITKNAFEGKPYLLFESAESKQEREETIRKWNISECEQEGYDRAKGLRESQLAVLKAKKNPTRQDLIQIEDLENNLAEGLVGRDDYDRYFEECMYRNGYER
jgi:hypothetical protein